METKYCETCNRCLAYCECKKEETPCVSKQYGWVCPKCGAGNSPYATHCPCTPIKYNLGDVTC